MTKSYIEGNSGLVKRMKREGHLVGNHTVNHPSLPSCSAERIQTELKECASYMKKKTGFAMDPYMRPPMGEWSDRVLKVAQDLGYTTVFWSMAFYDYDEAAQPGAKAIYSQFMKYYHKGAVPLIHVISSSDTEALPDILQSMKDMGFVFCRLDEVVRKTRPVKIKLKEAREIYRRLNGDIVQNYECRYPVIKKAGKAGEVINSDIKILRRAFKEQADEQYRLSGNSLGDSRIGPGLPTGYFGQKMKVLYNENGLLSLRVKEYSCALAAVRGITCDNSAVYDLKSGKKVSLARLLNVSRIRQANARVKKALRKKYGRISEMKEKIKKVKYGDYHYYLTKQGNVRIVFDPYYFDRSARKVTL